VRTIQHIVCAAAAAALALPGIASAATPRPGDPSIDQYIEAIPTSAGPQSAVGAAERVQPLTLRAARQVKAKAGSDADALTKIATSSRYGAPVESGDNRSTAPPSDKPAETKEGAEKSALEQMPALQTAESAESRLVALVVFMVASLVTALVYKVFRRRSRQPDR
jgi:hypothetical protein